MGYNMTTLKIGFDNFFDTQIKFGEDLHALVLGQLHESVFNSGALAASADTNWAFTALKLGQWDKDPVLEQLPYWVMLELEIANTDGGDFIFYEGITSYTGATSLDFIPNRNRIKTPEVPLDIITDATPTLGAPTTLTSGTLAATIPKTIQYILKPEAKYNLKLTNTIVNGEWDIITKIKTLG